MKRSRSSLSTILTLVVAPAVVALAVTLLLLTLWDRQQEPETITLPTLSGTSLIPPRGEAAGGSSDGGSNGEGENVAVSDEGEGAAEDTGPCENQIHTVAAGETLGAIAEQYGMSLEDLTLMNQMVDPAFDPNFLSIGQQIVIPTCGVPTPTPSPTPTETPVPTRNIPTPGPTATELSGGQVTVGVARVLNPGDVTSEAVEIINRGTSVARLGGWRLVNERTEEAFTFPPLNLFPQGAVTVYTGVGENTAIDIYWGRDGSVWQPGDTLQLYDANEELQDEFDIPER